MRVALLLCASVLFVDSQAPPTCGGITDKKATCTTGSCSPERNAKCVGSFFSKKCVCPDDMCSVDGRTCVKKNSEAAHGPKPKCMSGALEDPRATCSSGDCSPERNAVCKGSTFNRRCFCADDTCSVDGRTCVKKKTVPQRLPPHLHAWQELCLTPELRVTRVTAQKNAMPSVKEAHSTKDVFVILVCAAWMVKPV